MTIYIEKDWQLIEDRFEERSAILEYDASYPRYEAEQLAAQQMGYANKADLKTHIQKIKAELNNG
jgi:hypothetical protein